MKIIGCEIYNNGIGIEMPTDANITVLGTKIHGNGIGIKLTGVPRDLAVEVVEAVRGGAQVDDVRSRYGERLKSGGVDLDRLLSRGADLTTIASALATAFGIGT